MKAQKVISAMLTLLLVLTCALAPASAANESGTCGSNAYWSYNTQTATLTISGTGGINGYETLNVGSDGSINVGASVPWEHFSSEIRTIIIEEGITGIGESAFKKLDNLSDVKFPDSLKIIGNYAFTRCGKLDRVVIPAGVEYIGCNAFLGRWEETKPYVYFLGDAPNAKSSGGLGRSFSDHTVLYHLSSASGWSGYSWNGYQTEMWNGYEYQDPLYKENQNEFPEENWNTGLEVEEWETTWNPSFTDSYNMTVKVTGTQEFSYAYRVIDLVNDLRVQRGLSPLETDDKLMDTAMQRAAECSVYYSHTRPNDTSCFDIFPSSTAHGENIAAGYSSSDMVMHDWTNSPGHYANMVNGNYKSIGVGCFYIDGHYYWAQAFSNGQPKKHFRNSDAMSTVSVSVSSEHFNLKHINDEVNIALEKSVQVPIQIINDGFNGTPVTIQFEQADYTYPSIIAVSGNPPYITGKYPGSGTVRIKFRNGKSFSFDVNVLSPYRDVSTSDWYYDSVNWANEKGIIDSASQTYFGATMLMNRGMTATLLYRLDDPSDVVWPMYFTDVNSGNSEPINWVASCGLMNGYGNNIFGPDDTLTREQLAAILYRYAQYKNINTTRLADISGYSDVSSISGYAIIPICWANGEGLMMGTSSTTLSPQKNVTKAETAAIFMRFCKKFGEG